jgi:endonuclease III
MMDKQERAIAIIKLLREATVGMEQPASVQIVQKYGKKPFLILISCLLSLRTRDPVSFAASVRLFDHAKTPSQLLELPISQIEKLIYPTGFYRRKAHLLHAVSRELITRFNGKVPDNYNALTSIKGVGSKTANLVLGVAFDIPAICVDTHVHRISNRLGLVSTKTVEQTEAALKELLPRRYWVEYNHLMVMWGQNICVPISPKCSQCVLLPLCPQKGVTTYR